MENIDFTTIFGDSSLAMYFKPWVLQVFVVVLAVLLINFAFRIFLRKLSARAEKTANPWDDAFIQAAHKPFRLLVWVIGILFAAEIVASQSDAEIFRAIGPIRNVTIVATLAWFLIRFIKEFEKAYIKRQREKGNPVDLTTTNALAKLVRASIFITAALVMLQTLGFSISGVLAFGGIGGIAVGFAAKDLLSNFFGGLMVYLDRPFKAGDWIRSPDKELEGTVEEIGWRQTRIRTFSKRPIYVPNSIFMNIIVENPSRMSHRRIYETIGLRYSDIAVVDDIVKDVKEMLISHDEIDTNQTMIVNFNEFSESSVDFFIYTFTKTTNWLKFHEVKHEVLLKVYEIIKKHNADVAFPTRVLQVETSDTSTLTKS
ncbi:MAG: mechanosensitive ion channel family protein [Gammaproteobacteria bacterium]|nr:mechanosensitive ion channel family protein [Gammaproteobacteria bacterium]